MFPLSDWLNFFIECCVFNSITKFCCVGSHSRIAYLNVVAVPPASEMTGCWCLSCSFIMLAHAQSVWVDADHDDDTADCGSRQRPCLTVQHGVDVAGDTIWLASARFPCENAPNGVTIVSKRVSVSSAVGMTRFDCGGASRAFWVRESGVSFSDIAVVNGRAQQARAIRSRSAK